MSDSVEQYLRQSQEALDASIGSADFVSSIRMIADACTSCLRGGGKLLFAGNGGSAGDAQHIAGEFVSRLNFDRAPLAALALTTDTSIITAVGNDYGYDQVFVRQVLALARHGDILVALSTSGRSKNILAALEAGREIGTVNVGMGQSGAEMFRLCDLTLAVPATSTPLIQQVYMVAAHAFCGEVETALFKK